MTRAATKSRKRYAPGKIRGDPFGAQPDALAFDKSGRTLYVCNGTQNAVAVFHFQPGKSRLQGLIPVGWFPGAMVFDARREVIEVANIKNIGDRMERARSGPGAGLQQPAVLPARSPWCRRRTEETLAGCTRTVLANMRYPLLARAGLPPRPDQPAQPVPSASANRVFSSTSFTLSSRTAPTTRYWVT